MELLDNSPKRHRLAWGLLIVASLFALPDLLHAIVDVYGRF